ncbi:MAG: histidine phosphatase family protein [archaeon]|nr:MAG: histidine phosphatase family protein [archaeon]
MKLYLVRHGQRGKFEKYDTLTPAGVEQAKKLGPYFKNKKIDIVYCSPQKRARNTLKYIKPYLEGSPSVKISRQVRQKGAPDEMGEEVIKKLGIKTDTQEQLDKRVLKFLNFLVKNHVNDTILVSTHKMFILSVISTLLPSKRKKYIKTPPASVTYFELDKKLKVKKFSIGGLKI